MNKYLIGNANEDVYGHLFGHYKQAIIENLSHKTN